MPDTQVLTAAQPATITPESTNGAGEKTYQEHMEHEIKKAFAQAKPEEFKMPPEKPSREVNPTPADTSAHRVEGSEVPDLPSDNVRKAEKTPAKDEPSKPVVKAAQWKELNEERARLKTENESLKNEQEKWKQWEAERKEYDTIKRHNSELLDRIQTIAVEKDPRFENYFKTKTETAIALAKQAVGDSHAERVSKLLQLPDSDWRTEQIDAVMSELSPTRQSRLGAAIIEMDRVNLERSTAISKSKENFEAMQKADRDRAQGQKQEFERIFQDTLEKWSHPEKGIGLFRKKEGDEAHNAEVEQRIKTARDILNLKLGADQLTKAALWAAAAPGLLKNQMAMAEENASLKAELQALKSGEPELKGSSETSDESDDERRYEGMSYAEIITEKARKAGAWAT